MGELSIRELKQRGREAVSNYLPQAVLVSFLLSLFTGGNNQVISRGKEYAQSGSGSVITTVLMLVLGIVVVVGLIVLLLHIFVLDILEVGKNRFYMESRELERSAGVGKLFWAFGSGNYLNVVKIIFIRNVKVFLWSLLLVLPGIYKAYEYAMIPYILSENPETSSGEAFRMSRKLMDGRRFKLFCLEISYLLWYLIPVVLTIFSPLIGAVALLIVELLISPYLEASVAEFYANLRGEIDEIRLHGFTEASRRDWQESSDDYWR